jgi:hypothetical protein
VNTRHKVVTTVGTTTRFDSPISKSVMYNNNNGGPGRATGAGDETKAQSEEHKNAEEI